MQTTRCKLVGKRGKDYEFNLWKMWRLFDTEFNSGSGARRRVKKVRAYEKILFGESQERYLFGFIAIWRIKEASVDDTGTGRGKSWFTCGADGKTGGSDGAVQGTGSDALGAENE